MIFSYLVVIFSFGLAHLAPQGVKTEGNLTGEEMVIRLVLRIQKTQNGAQLVVDLEQNPDVSNEMRSPLKPLTSLSTDMSIGKKAENKSEVFYITEEKAKSKTAVIDLPLFRPKLISQTDTEKNGPIKTTAKNNEYLSANSETEVKEKAKIEPVVDDLYRPKFISTTDIKKINEPIRRPPKNNEYLYINTQVEDPKLESAISDSQRFRPKFISQSGSRTTNSAIINQSEKNHFENSPSEFQNRPKLEFKISVGQSNPISKVTSKFSNTLRTTTPIVPTRKKFSTTAKYGESGILASTENVTDNEAIEVEGTNVNKAVADEGFGVLASRCASFAPGLVSDGAGGCTKAVNKSKKKSYQNPYSFRSAERNELHSDIKTTTADIQESLDTTTS